MYQKERLDLILAILHEQQYATVSDLTERLHYSTATVNRDLNVLQAQMLVKRTYGGVELLHKRGVPLPFRYHVMRPEKNKIARAAASLVRNGDCIFIDASTTTQAMGHFLSEKRELTVITHNMALAVQMSETGHKVLCLGGAVRERPCMLCSEETVELARRYRADRLFFSVGYVDETGRIGGGGYDALHRAMADNSKEIYLLVDRDKVNGEHLPSRYLFDFSHLTGVISDHEFQEETKKAFPHVRFIKA